MSYFVLPSQFFYFLNVSFSSLITSFGKRELFGFFLAINYS